MRNLSRPDARANLKISKFFRLAPKHLDTCLGYARCRIMPPFVTGVYDCVFSFGVKPLDPL
jgi:hypothetical protein